MFVQVLRTHLAEPAQASDPGWIRALADERIAPALRLMHGDPVRSWKRPAWLRSRTPPRAGGTCAALRSKYDLFRRPVSRLHLRERHQKRFQARGRRLPQKIPFRSHSDRRRGSHHLRGARLGMPSAGPPDTRRDLGRQTSRKSGEGHGAAGCRPARGQQGVACTVHPSCRTGYLSGSATLRSSAGLPFQTRGSAGGRLSESGMFT